MKYLTVLFAILILIITGCSPKTVQLTTTDQSKTAQTPKDYRDTGKTGEISEEELARRERMKEWALKELLASSPMRDILFEFDSYSIQQEYTAKLNEIANWLKNHKDVSIVVEGHCDERGTLEYNLALGQKRAEAVKSYLVKLGVESERIRPISYGKELPIDTGHTENAWTKNRRAHFQIEKKG